MGNDEKQLSLLGEHIQVDNGPVVCLGMKFENDEARREYFRNELRKKLPELKEIEGFPIGEDEDIIALSDPPYYTACPNPWINEFIGEWEQEKVERYGRDLNEEYHREPFAADVSEGKNHPIYMGHAYHTKVPHRAIMRYILHYTKPGDIVLDGFCGTGMTAVAARYCESLEEIKELQYKVSENKVFSADDEYISDLGKRNVLINDLSPIATFISSNYNKKANLIKFKETVGSIIEDIENEFGWMYETLHDSTNMGKINHVIWSDVFICPNCSRELVFWDEAVDLENKKIRDRFCCPTCKVELGKRDMERVKETSVDFANAQIVTKSKLVPVLINYSFQGSRYSKEPTEIDIELLREIERYAQNYWYPTDEFPKGHNTEQPIRSHGFKNVHHLLSIRNNIVLAAFYNKIKSFDEKDLATFLLTSSLINLTFLYRWRTSGKGGATSGTYYVCSTPQENNPFSQLKRKLNDICNLKLIDGSAVISTNSTTEIQVMDNSIDYIFTDPPFGANLMYSELNYLWESWLKVFSNNSHEAIVNNVQSKTIAEYQELMTNCFKEYYRVLKPGKWITVEFSNSQASIWNSIQESLQRSGFIIANVAALDKKQGSFKAVTSTTAVKQDLVISAYKPTEENIEKMKKEQNTEDSAWTFVRQYLGQLPIFIGIKGEAKVIAERTPRILFDRMVAYHVQNGLTVPISSAEFQAGVTQRFLIRDGMAFLESQVAEYDKKRTLVKEFAQMSLFVSDENSAIEWIRQQLLKKPQTRQDLHPNYMKEIQHIAKHELLPELDDLLHQNFLFFEGDGGVPDQIASYLRRNYKDLRSVDTTDLVFVEKAMNRWYVPDPNKQADLEKLREKSLLREFSGYVEELENSKKKLKQFRTEAIRAGFKKAYSEKEFEQIVKVGDRLPEKIIQEDDKLLMYYDNACIRLGL
ncbi:MULTISPECIES: DNA methyltransferase [unclassified Bacillus cereus group]|uniref:DNA methyltransferase n=1 Tax=unclassified Bacillus cereus group TaxID=2750818 RepID=UPI001F597F15|nr:MULTISPECIES: DNA methyltransferase [unclassified Bacillus cereus group]